MRGIVSQQSITFEMVFQMKNQRFKTCNAERNALQISKHLFDWQIHITVCRGRTKTPEETVNVVKRERFEELSDAIV
jgi:hypothetical protein